MFLLKQAGSAPGTDCEAAVALLHLVTGPELLKANLSKEIFCLQDI